jgi:TetR/AcrR family transcriptional repressor of nem operon
MGADMRVTREQAMSNRASILATAARLFREKGPDAVSVAEIMQAAGMTHGGFYGHFASKQALLEEALGLALAESAQPLGEGGNLTDFVSAYLSGEHLVHPETGCAIAALGADMARQPSEVRAVFAHGIREFVQAIQEAGELDGRAAMAALATMVGAMVIARAVASADRPLAMQILKAARSKLVPDVRNHTRRGGER